MHTLIFDFSTRQYYSLHHLNQLNELSIFKLDFDYVRRDIVYKLSWQFFRSIN